MTLQKCVCSCEVFQENQDRCTWQKFTVTNGDPDHWEFDWSDDVDVTSIECTACHRLYEWVDGSLVPAKVEEAKPKRKRFSWQELPAK